MEAAYLAVARFRKPHGLKGDALFWVLTDEPEQVFVTGRTLTPIDEVGHPVGDPLKIERERRYHGSWLVKFHEIADRGALEQWDQVLLGVSQADLTPPGDEEMYVHEIPGVSVLAHGAVIGKARGLIDVPGGKLLAVDVGGKQVLVPFRKPILVSMCRAERQIEIDPPPGLLDL